MTQGSLADLMNMESLAESPTPVRATGGGLGDQKVVDVHNKDGTVAEGGAAVAEGEYVVPADVLAMLGDGSSEAGARVLTTLFDNIRASKQGGSTEQAESITNLLA